MGYGLIGCGFDICAIASDGWIEYLVIVLTVEIKGLGPFVIYQWTKLSGYVRKRVCRWLRGKECRWLRGKEEGADVGEVIRTELWSHLF